MSSKTASFSSLLGIAALAVANSAAFAADMPNAASGKVMAPTGSEKCYGVAKAAKNDCAAGVHSCAGQATKDFDKTSFVYLPVGVCGKLAGGTMTAMMAK
jgi:uncharacterized membrane protein